MVLRSLRLIAQTSLLWLVYQTGNFIVSWTHLPLPGNVMGMVLLFALLLSGIIRPSHIQEAAAVLLKHMSFFFIPIAVGLMNWGQLFYDHSFALAITLLVSTTVALLATGFTVQRLPKGADNDE